MNKDYALKRLKAAGFKIEKLGKSIIATKQTKSGEKLKYAGRVFHVYKSVFGY